MLDWMPEQASSWASQVDWINNFITWVSVFCTLAICGVMLYYAVRYRQRDGKHHPTPNITHNAALEALWTAIPTLVCIFVFYYGFVVYRDMREVPANALEIQVKGAKWRWDFVYPNGKLTTGELVVPVDKPIRLVMSSSDVLHSFFIPVMRVKEDVVPGKYAYLWFHPEKTGEFPIFCTEYCGLNHSNMLAKLRVVSPEEYQDYILDRSVAEIPPVELGEKLYTQKTCNVCHSLDGKSGVGPSFKGLFGSNREFVDGTTAVADENYIRESILNSNAKIVKGFAPAMPAFQGQLSDTELDGIIAYLKTIKE